MTKIYYKRRFGSFECVKIEGAGRIAKFIFDEPLDALLRIDKNHTNIKCGEGDLDLSALSAGVYEPKLQKKNSCERLGKVMLTEGGVSYNTPDFDYVRTLADRVFELSEELNALKAENEKIKSKIYGTSIF